MSLLGIVRVLHIVSAVFWAGTMFFFVTFLEPTVRSLGPEGGQFMQALVARRFFNILISIAFFTLLSGFYVFWQLTDGFSPEWRQSAYTHTLLAGAAFGILTILVGLFVSRPTMERMTGKAQAMAASGKPPSPADLAELDALRTRLRLAGRTAATLLLLAVIAMASARYI